MSRGIITISKMGAVTVPTASVWMTKFEIADLFWVFSCDIRKAIQEIYKNKELNEADTMRYIRLLPNIIIYISYNKDIIFYIDINWEQLSNILLRCQLVLRYSGD